MWSFFPLLPPFILHPTDVCSAGITALSKHGLSVIWWWNAYTYSSHSNSQYTLALVAFTINALYVSKCACSTYDAVQAHKWISPCSTYIAHTGIQYEPALVRIIILFRCRDRFNGTVCRSSCLHWVQTLHTARISLHIYVLYHSTSSQQATQYYATQGTVLGRLHPTIILHCCCVQSLSHHIATKRHRSNPEHGDHCHPYNYILCYYAQWVNESTKPQQLLWPITKQCM